MMTNQDITNQPKTYRVLASRKGMSNEDWLKLRKGYLNISEVSAARLLSKEIRLQGPDCAVHPPIHSVQLHLRKHRWRGYFS